MRITEYALKLKVTVYVLILMIIIVGINSYRAMPVESAPDVPIPIIMVQTIYPGVAPEDMEQLVSTIVERELKDLDDVKKMSSSSSESVSIVTIEFETEVDMDDAYQKVRDKVDKAKPDLPADAEDPVLIEINVSEFPILLINVLGGYGMARLKKVAEGLEESIETVPGVLGVDLVGGREREIQIFLNPDRMRYYKMGVGQILTRIGQEHLTTPAGNLELGGSKYTVRIPGEYRNVHLMEDIVLKAPGGKPIKLKDVGRVHDGYKDRETISRANGSECITLRVKKRTGENIVEIADAIRLLLEEEKSRLPAGTSYIIRQDQSKVVRDMVYDLENNIITALILVLLVLFFAMGLKNASFVALAIPMSMLITFVFLRAMDITLNMVVLFSLIIALGMLVDNSIVVIENIYRHASEGASRSKAALFGTREVAMPIIASTATTVVVFAPLIFWPGIMGSFMKYLPITVITALLASLFVAMVINPVVAANFLKISGKKLFDDSGEVKGPIMRRYKSLLSWSLDHPLTLMAMGLTLLMLMFGLYYEFGAGVELFPSTQPKRAQAIIMAPQGTTIDRTDSFLKEIEALARTEENVKDIIANVGIGGGHVMVGGGGGSTHQGVVDLEFIDRQQRKRATTEDIRSLREKLSHMAGGEFRVEKEKMGPPTGEAVAIEISGDDYKILNRYARQVKELISQIPDVVDIKDDYEGGKPEIRIVVDREQAMLRKVNTSSISTAVRAAINGLKASVLREGDEEYDILVRYDEDYRTSINDILDITVSGKDDVQIPLRDVAKVETTGGLGSVKHIDRKRTVKISADVMDRSSAEVMVDVKDLLTRRLKLPPGYFVRFSGESKDQEEARAFLSEAFSIGIMLIMMILITQFNSIFRPAIILASVVMSLIGVLFGLIIVQNKFGIIMTGLGIISLAGVVVNNAIVLIDYTDQLKKKHGLHLREALLRAGVVRFRPVLLTAITTILGMMPMALGIGIDFRNLKVDIGAESVEWWAPMAQTIIFGLAVSTVMTLIMVPVMYLSQEKLVEWVRKRVPWLIPVHGHNQKLED